MKVSHFREQSADREAIRDCIYRYSRALDRCDVDVLRSVYWEDAYDDHGMFAGSREEFVAWVIPFVASMEATQHRMINMLIRIDGNIAEGEVYYDAYHRLEHGGAKIELIAAGRYLDRYEKRSDEWRISRREVIVDWFRLFDDSCDMQAGPLGNPINPGRRRPEDQSYAKLGLLSLSH